MILAEVVIMAAGVLLGAGAAMAMLGVAVWKLTGDSND